MMNIHGLRITQKTSRLSPSGALQESLHPLLKFTKSQFDRKYILPFLYNGSRSYLQQSQNIGGISSLNALRRSSVGRRYRENIFLSYERRELGHFQVTHITVRPGALRVYCAPL